MKKAQITIFIVLGIVVMIIFGLVFFISRQTSSAFLERQVDRAYKGFLGATDIKEYVSGCLDRSIKDALRLAALQGGKIYSYQVEGGYEITSIDETIPFDYTLRNPNGTIFNVSYGIKAPTPGFAGNLPVPQYPYSGGLVNSSSIKSPFAFYSYLYYPYTLTPLCNGYGPNYFNITNATYSCEMWDRLETSMQDYMEEYIEENVKRCVNFYQFIERTSYNISEGEIKAFVLIGDYDVFVFVKYPLIITVKNKASATRFLDFSKRIDVRLKKVHELAMHLIGLRSIIKSKEPETESDNIFFNITRDDPHDCRRHLKSYSFNEPCILDGMEVNKIKDYCLDNPICDYLPEHYRYSDIIKITDRKSIIDGEPLMFLFGVENRIPALDFTADMTVREDDEIEFFALDPDEDDLIYNVSNAAFEKIENNRFNATLAGDYRVVINVSDNEGLYDYQIVDIRVNS